MIRFENLSKNYDDFLAVDGINMHVRKGHIHAFIGANGSGKTTTLKCLVGLLTPKDGSIHVNDINIAEEPVKAKEQMGYLPESQYLYPELTAEEYLRFIGRLRSQPDQEISEHIDRFLALFALEDARHQLIGGFSTGMTKKIALAGTIIGKPPAIILDEPTSGLDPPSVYLFKELIRELQKQGHTILVASHNLPFLEDLADHFSMLDKGKIIADGTLDSLRQEHNSPDASLEELYIKISGRKIADLSQLFDA